MNQYDKALKNVRITVHGGMDYKDETPEAFNFGGHGHGHPIMTIEIGQTIKHFKCTSIDTSINKAYRTHNQYYKLQDPSACQLDKTIKAIAKPETKPVVDFNHSIHILNDETPPLRIIPSGQRHGTIRDQTSFEVSNRDKKGILTHLIRHAYANGSIRQPLVSKEDCIIADNEWLQGHPHHKPHAVQVVTEKPLELNMDDLELAENIINQLIN